jgi:hypothetical protein
MAAAGSSGSAVAALLASHTGPSDKAFKQRLAIAHDTDRRRAVPLEARAQQEEVARHKKIIQRDAIRQPVVNGGRLTVSPDTYNALVNGRCDLCLAPFDSYINVGIVLPCGHGCHLNCYYKFIYNGPVYDEDGFTRKFFGPPPPPTMYLCEEQLHPDAPSNGSLRENICPLIHAFDEEDQYPIFLGNIDSIGEAGDTGIVFEMPDLVYSRISKLKTDNSIFDSALAIMLGNIDTLREIDERTKERLKDEIIAQSKIDFQEFKLSLGYNFRKFDILSSVDTVFKNNGMLSISRYPSLLRYAHYGGNRRKSRKSRKSRKRKSRKSRKRKSHKS